MNADTVAALVFCVACGCAAGVLVRAALAWEGGAL